MATFNDEMQARAQNAYAGQTAVPYAGLPLVDVVPVQERLNTLGNILRAVHASLDNLESMPGPTPDFMLKAKNIDGIGPGSMPGCCMLAEQALALAEHLDMRVRTLGARIGRL